jgi:hypothetical protein
MKEQDARLMGSAVLFTAILLLSACQKAPGLTTMAPGDAEHATAPAASDHHVPAPALQPYDPTRPQPQHDSPSTRPRPGMPHPALVKETRAGAAALPDRLLPTSGAVVRVRGKS